MKTWHIWDFPDKINVILKDEIHEEFFNYMFNKFGGKRPYARFLGIYQNHVKSIHKKCFKKNGKTYNFYLPNWILKKSLPLLNKSLKIKIENNILAIKCSGTGIKVLNPKLPLKESKEIYRILAHLLGDGFAGERKVPYYANTCDKLRKQFKKDLQIFGEVTTYERTPCTTPYLMFPKVIADILKHTFEISFTRPSKLPSLIFNSKKESKKEFLKAFFDDEGTMSSTVSISQSNPNLLNEIKYLVEELGIKTGKISQKGTKYFSFGILKKSLTDYFVDISFDHPTKKKKIELALKTQSRKQRTRPPIFFENEILKLLHKRQLKTLDTANEISLTLCPTLRHLKDLESKNKITKMDKGNYFLGKI